MERVLLRGGAPQTVVQNPLVQGAGAGGVWGEDDMVYYTDTGIRRAPSSGGDPEVVPSQVGALAWLSSLPDAGRLLATNWIEPAEIGVLELVSGEWKPFPGISGYRPHYVEPS